MKDTLHDIIQYTSALGFIDLIKVTGTDTSTTINAVAEDKSVIVKGTFKNPHPGFIGVFGMPNLGKLKTILSFDDYDEHAKISMTHTNRDGVDTPDSIHFETKDGSFVNDYRLMARSIIDDKVKNIAYTGNGWDVEFEPAVDGIKRLKKQASANSEEENFATKLENGELRIYFGDPSTHSGNFIFQDNISGTLTSKWLWPVNQVMSILNLPGDKKYRINDKGATEITVDSGLAVYQYLLPAKQK